MASKLLSDAITDYLNYRRAAYRKNTVHASETSLRQFLAFTGNIQTKSLTPRHAERFQMQLMGAGHKPATVNSRMSQVSAFGNWAVANRLIPTQFTTTTRTIPIPKTPRLRVPARDFQRLLDSAERPDRRIAVALGLFLFVRSSEMQTLRVGNVDLQEGTVAVTVHKTNDWDEMPICAELDAELRRWFIYYAEDLGRPLEPGDFLVPGRKHFFPWADPNAPGKYDPHRMMLRPFQHIQPILEAAGYKLDMEGKSGREGMHTLRRSGARALYDALVDGVIGDPTARDDALRQVMTMLHHASVQTTERYIGLERDRQKRDITIKGQSFLPRPGENVVKLRRE